MAETIGGSAKGALYDQNTKKVVNNPKVVKNNGVASGTARLNNGVVSGTARLDNSLNQYKAASDKATTADKALAAANSAAKSKTDLQKLRDAQDRDTAKDKALAKQAYEARNNPPAAGADTGGGGGGSSGSGSFYTKPTSEEYYYGDSSGSSGGSRIIPGDSREIPGGTSGGSRITRIISGGSRKIPGGTSTTTPQTTLNSLVDSLYGAQDTAYQGMADSANASLKAAYDYNLQKQAAERDEALREAYIQGEMSKRNIAEQLSRQGITGGAAESTLARLISNYQGARNEARGDYASGVQEMGNNYMTNVNQNTNYYKQQAQTRKNTIYDTLLNYLLENYGKTRQTGTTKSYTYDENGNVTGITETPQYSVDTDTAKKLAAIIGSLSA